MADEEIDIGFVPAKAYDKGIDILVIVLVCGFLVWASKSYAAILGSISALCIWAVARPHFKCKEE